MKIMTEGMGELEKRGIGSKAARKQISDLAYIAHYKEFGTDMWTQKAPDRAYLAWVEDEIAKEALRNDEASEP